MKENKKDNWWKKVKPMMQPPVGPPPSAPPGPASPGPPPPPSVKPNIKRKA